MDASSHATFRPFLLLLLAALCSCLCASCAATTPQILTAGGVTIAAAIGAVTKAMETGSLDPQLGSVMLDAMHAVQAQLAQNALGEQLQHLQTTVDGLAPAVAGAANAADQVQAGAATQQVVGYGTAGLLGTYVTRKAWWPLLAAAVRGATGAMAAAHPPEQPPR